MDETTSSGNDAVPVTTKKRDTPTLPVPTFELLFTPQGKIYIPSGSTSTFI
jgi:hypothetical protein